jgi:hypothetical protein
MCLGESRSLSFASARTDEEYVLALDAATRRGEALWRGEGATWRGDVHTVGCPGHRVTVRRDGDRRGVPETVDRRGRRLHRVLAGNDDASLLVALTRLVVSVRGADQARRLRPRSAPVDPVIRTVPQPR